MSDWVVELFQQMEAEEARRKHILATLPDEINGFWSALQNTLRANIEKLNSYFQRKIGAIELKVEEPSTIKIMKSEYPAYYIDVRLDYPVDHEDILLPHGEIRIQREVAFSLEAASPFPDTILTLELGPEDDLVIQGDKGSIPRREALQRISKFILVPVIRREFPS
jgi:hypothetical protein